MPEQEHPPVIRRVGGLEGVGLLCWLFLAVIRRVGGLEVHERPHARENLVIRRVGGLEELPPFPASLG